MVDPPNGPAAPPRAPEGPRARLLVLFALTGFAISQPLLSVLGSNPTLFTFHKVTGWTIVWIALAIAVIPPLVLWAVELLAATVSTSLGRGVHLVIVGALTALTAVQVTKAFGATNGWVVTLLALAAGIAFAAAYDRYRTVSTWVQFASPLPLVAVGLFVFSSAMSALLTTPATPSAVEDGRAHPSVVVVMLDELPTLSLLDERGDIDPVRFPNLAQLAEQSTWYPRYSTLAPYTTAAVPSMLASTEPVDAAPVWSEHPDNIFTLLAPTHDLSVFESLTYLCGSEQCAGSGQDGAAAVASRPRLGELVRQVGELWRARVMPTDDDVERLDDFEERLRYNPNALREESELSGLDAVRARPERLDQFLTGLAETADRPTFHYLHLLLPHHPWRFYSDGQVYDPPSVPDVAELYPFDYDNAFGPWVAALTEERHLQQAQYTDLLIGDVIDALRSAGTYDESVVVVTADHGASFRPGEPMREATPRNVADIAYVPLLVKDANQQVGRVDESNLSAVDLLPTVADLVGVEPDWDVAGAAAGSPEVAARGDEKRFFDFRGGVGERELHGVLTFDGERERPRARERSIEPPTVAWAPMLGLYRAFGLDRHLGRPPPLTASALLDPTGEVAAGDAALAFEPPAVDEPVANDDSNDEDAGEGADANEVAHAEVVALDALRRPPDDVPPPGLVTGRITDGPEQGDVLVVVDGIVRAASPVYAIDGRDGWFAALLPPGALGRTNEIRLVLVAGDEAIDLELSDR